MNPNEVKLIDFDKETLSQVSLCLSHKINQLSFTANNERLKERENLIEFRTQVLYAFSLVKDSEKVTSN